MSRFTKSEEKKYRFSYTEKQGYTIIAPRNTINYMYIQETPPSPPEQFPDKADIQNRPVIPQCEQ